MAESVFIALGSNLGDKEANLKEAVRLLKERDDLKVKGSSSIYLSKPFDGSDQPDYLNSLIEIESSIEPVDLLRVLKEIESDMGRDPDGERWASRVIDLDIIYYGNRVISEEGLIIPHPQATLRDFVMKPLSEISPDFKDPLLELTARELAVALVSDSPCRVLKK